MTFNLSAPPNFKGLNKYLPVRRYERHLPHWRQDGATYFCKEDQPQTDFWSQPKGICKFYGTLAKEAVKLREAMRKHHAACKQANEQKSKIR